MLRVVSTKLGRTFSRNISSLHLNEEVRAALAEKRPVVALESTIITHGLPFPANVEMAQSVEQAVRDEGAVPATIAFLNGSAKVGLNATQLQQLAESSDPHKISRRDIAFAVSRGLSGGTTIAGTMILADLAGIRVFATGGLGGVHRGVEKHLDISADLEELGRTPVAVVCSGPKSILDVPKTMEYLETKGCHVATLSKDGRPVNIPGFFVADSKVPSPFTFRGPKDAARTIGSGLELGLKSGYVFCVPVPPEMALDQELADSAIEFALREAEKNGISGKESTPFLLKKVWEATGGVSVKTNVEFVKNNARLASKIAIELQKLKSKEAAQAEVKSEMKSEMKPDVKPQKPEVKSGQTTLKPCKSYITDVAVIGALSQDLTCTLETDTVSVSSYPGRVTTSLGGTAHNVALASAYCGARTRLISRIGDGEALEITKSVSPALDVGGVHISQNERTPRYVCTNDSSGELIVACADMDAIQRFGSKIVSKELKKAEPKVCVFDGNLGQDAVAEVLKTSRSLKSDPLIVFEPTSVPKAAKLAHQKLGVFPHHSLDIATPNFLELMSMYEEFSYREKLDVTHWFPIIDQLPLSDAVSRMKLDIFSRSHPALADIVQSGLVQASVQLLPYIPNLFVTTGKNGIVSFQLIENLKDRTGGIIGGPNSVYILSRSKPYGLLIQHFPVTVEVLKEDAKSVNGIGDTFCGALVSQLAENRMWLRDDGTVKKEAIDRAMHAASLSLKTFQAVNSEISTLFH